jgi:hypothetical protein
MVTKPGTLMQEVNINEDEDFLFIGSREPCAVIAGPCKNQCPLPAAYVSD